MSASAGSAAASKPKAGLVGAPSLATSVAQGRPAAAAAAAVSKAPLSKPATVSAAPVSAAKGIPKVATAVVATKATPLMNAPKAAPKAAPTAGAPKATASAGAPKAGPTAGPANGATGSASRTSSSSSATRLGSVKAEDSSHDDAAKAPGKPPAKATATKTATPSPTETATATARATATATATATRGGSAKAHDGAVAKGDGKGKGAGKGRGKGETGGGSKAEGKAKKEGEMSVEESWKQLDESEQALHRPDTMIGSVVFTTEPFWVVDHSQDTPESEGQGKARADRGDEDADPMEEGEESVRPPRKGDRKPQVVVKSEPKSEPPDRGGRNDGKDGMDEKDSKDSEVKDEKMEEAQTAGTGLATPRFSKAEPATPRSGGSPVAGGGSPDGGGAFGSGGLRLVRRKLSYVPGLYKIVDEPLVNASDQVQRGAKVTLIKVDVDQATGTVSIYNNGAGLPVKRHTTADCWLPELIFGRWRSSSNYDDREERITGGRNGLGVKCTNLMSKRFTVEVQDGDAKLKYRQTWTDNMKHKTEPEVTPCAKKSYVKISFKPDFARFGGKKAMRGFDQDMMDLLERRVVDLAAVTGVKVVYNGSPVPVRSFPELLALVAASTGADAANDEGDGDGDGNDGDERMGDEGDEKGAKEKPAARVYERLGGRGKKGGGWEVGVLATDGSSFEQVSFVNGVSTFRGGPHVDAVVDQLVPAIQACVLKKSKVKLPAHIIKGHLFVLVNATVVNPSFESQTKHALAADKGSFDKTAALSARTIKKLLKSKLVDDLIDAATTKTNKAFKKSDGKQRGVPDLEKLTDATATAGKDRQKCVLILTEGDSAKTLAMAGLAVVGRKYYGVFPLKGKPVNPRDAKLAKILANDEFVAIKKCLGLKNGEKYTDTSQLRYGRVWIMADADADGHHITMLVYNMLQLYWPELVALPGFISTFVTPTVKVTKGKQKLAFYSNKAFYAWKATTKGADGWTPKWYKGLGTNTSAEGKEYFSNLPKHTVALHWGGANDLAAIELVFGKKAHSADARKRWLGAHRSIDPHAPQLADASGDAMENARQTGRISVSEYIHKQLIHYSMADNERHIPSVVDGLKPSGRKILFACFKRKLVREIKVNSLAGYVIEHAAYQHGEVSCTGTIVNMAQDFVGSNNVNLLVPSGQFGTRQEAGDNSASPRYINTLLSPMTRMLFSQEDDALLIHLTEEGVKIQPIYYLPILPLVLVNGCKGIGTGWSSRIPKYNPRDLAKLIKVLLTHPPTDNQRPSLDPTNHPLHPWIRNFRGTILPAGPAAQPPPKPLAAQPPTKPPAAPNPLAAPKPSAAAAGAPKAVVAPAPATDAKPLVAQAVHANAGASKSLASALVPVHGPADGPDNKAAVPPGSDAKSDAQRPGPAGSDAKRPGPAGSDAKRAGAAGGGGAVGSGAARVAAAGAGAGAAGAGGIGGGAAGGLAVREAALGAVAPRSYVVRGRFEVVARSEDGGQTVRIDEIPFDVSLTKYLAALRKLEAAGKVESVLDETTDEDIRYTVELSGPQIKAAEAKGVSIHKLLRLESSISMNSLVAFDAAGQLKRYASAHEILLEFYRVRLPFYDQRKTAQLAAMRAELVRLHSKARFIQLVVDEVIRVGKRKAAEVIRQLVEHRFPTIAKKAKSTKSKGADAPEETDELDDQPPEPLADQKADEKADEKSDENEKEGPDGAAAGPAGPAGYAGLRAGYDYLLSMPMWSLTQEKKEELDRAHADQQAALATLEKTAPRDMWSRDLDAFVAALDAKDVKEANDAKAAASGSANKKRTAASQATKSAKGTSGVKGATGGKVGKGDARATPRPSKHESARKAGKGKSGADRKRSKPPKPTLGRAPEY